MICSQIIRNRSVSDKANSVKKKKYGGIIAAAVLGVLLMSAIVVLLVQRGTGPRLSQMSVEENSFSSIKDGRKEDPQMQCSLIFDDIELPADLS